MLVLCHSYYEELKNRNICTVEKFISLESKFMSVLNLIWEVKHEYLNLLT